jgi:hypothetical protein
MLILSKHDEIVNTYKLLNSMITYLFKGDNLISAANLLQKKDKNRFKLYP